MNPQFGAMTYLVMNLGFGAVLAAVLWRWLRGIDRKAFTVSALTLLGLTAVFDNLIVGFGIVAYDPQLILGWRVFVAPVEDFGYALLAAFAVPAIWLALAPKERTDAS